jgi:hypothetical protein
MKVAFTSEMLVSNTTQFHNPEVLDLKIKMKFDAGSKIVRTQRFNHTKHCLYFWFHNVGIDLTLV